MGIIVNKPASDLTMPDLLVQLDIIEKDDAIRLPHRIGHMPVLMGGPVEASRGSCCTRPISTSSNRPC